MGYRRLQGKQLFIVLAAAIVLPTTCLKNLSILAYVSAVGAGVAEIGFHRTSNVLNWSGLPHFASTSPASQPKQEGTPSVFAMSFPGESTRSYTARNGNEQIHDF